jgi:hypothetical protein
MEIECSFTWSQKTPLVPNMSQVNPAHNFPLSFSNVQPGIVLPSEPRSSKWSPAFKFPDQIICYEYAINLGVRIAESV